MVLNGTAQQPGGTNAAVAPPSAAAESGTPTGNPGTSQSPRTYTEAELTKVVNDSKADLGREIKVYREENFRLKADNQTIPQLQEQLKKARDDSWKSMLESAKDNPAALNITQRKIELDRRESELQESIINHNRDKASWEGVKIDMIEHRITRVAEDNGISPELLKSLVPDGDTVKLDKIVKSLKSSGNIIPAGAAQIPPAQPVKPIPPLVRPDSGVTTGVGKDSVRAMIDAAKGKK